MDLKDNMSKPTEKCIRCHGKKYYYGKNLVVKTCDLCVIPELKSDSGLSIALGDITSIEPTKRSRGRPKKVMNEIQ